MDEYSIYFCSGNTIVFHTHNLGLTTDPNPALHDPVPRENTVCSVAYMQCQCDGF